LKNTSKTFKSETKHHVAFAKPRLVTMILTYTPWYQTHTILKVNSRLSVSGWT